MNKKTIRRIKSNLTDSVKKISDSREEFVVNAKTDFIRNRKLPFHTMLNFLLQMEGSTISNELMNYFQFARNTPTPSAFQQQRAKIKPEALYALFRTFTETFEAKGSYKGYQILAIDGSEIYIPKNEKDSDTFMYNGEKKQGWNRLHLNALYDIVNKIYVDVVINPGKKTGEKSALLTMIKKLNHSDKTIVIGDRGYESYQMIADLQAQKISFIIRVKKPSSNMGFLGKQNLPDTAEFDIPYTFKVASRHSFSREKSAAKVIADGYKIIQTRALSKLSTKTPLYTYDELRIVKCRIPSSVQAEEYLITNLSAEEFTTEEIKHLYKMRWGIETSFRELKYALSLMHFHSKKVDFIKQEIFARLTMYNFCHMITSHLKSEVTSRKNYSHQVNNACAIKICLEYFRGKIGPPELKELILRNTLPIRPDRSFMRKVKKKQPKTFNYRIS